MEILWCPFFAVKFVIRLPDSDPMTQSWLGPVVITYHRKYDCGLERSVVSFTKHTGPGKFTPQLETKNVWPTEPQISITDWNVVLRAKRCKLEDSLNQFKVSIKPAVCLNYSGDLRFGLSFYFLFTYVFHITSGLTSMCVREKWDSWDITNNVHVWLSSLSIKFINLSPPLMW